MEKKSTLDCTPIQLPDLGPGGGAGLQASLSYPYGDQGVGRRFLVSKQLHSDLVCGYLSSELLKGRAFAMASLNKLG